MFLKALKAFIITILYSFGKMCLGHYCPQNVFRKEKNSSEEPVDYANP